MIRLGDPLWLLLITGALIFALNGWLEGTAERSIRLSPEARAVIIENQRAVLGRTPTAGEVKRLERQWFVDELLFREALEDSVHLFNSEVRAAAIEAMRIRVTGTLPAPEPAALVNYYAEHLERYQAEPAVWFSHVYLQNESDATAALLGQLRAGSTIAGDRFWQGSEFSGSSRSMLRGLFGNSFVEALWSAPLDRWSGPLASKHGWHFVRPTRRLPARQLRFAEVTAEVESDYLVTIINARVDAFVADRAAAYDLEMPPVTVPVP
ncbi:MAG: peptidylprolyl isomerase [Pseudomonadota bacterium]